MLAFQENSLKPAVTPEEIVVVGVMGAPHGLRGFCYVQSDMMPQDNILNYKTWYLRKENVWHPMTAQEVKRQGHRFLVKFEECSDRDSVECLPRLPVGIKRSQLPVCEPGEYYWADLEGLSVETTAGLLLGKIDYLYDAGASPVMVVKGGAGEKHIPFVWQDTVISVCLNTAKVQFDWPF